MIGNISDSGDDIPQSITAKHEVTTIGEWVSVYIRFKWFRSVPRHDKGHYAEDVLLLLYLLSDPSSCNLRTSE